MKLGLALPQYGSFADPAKAAEIARAGEEMGFDSLWVGDRILVPRNPREPYPGGDGTIPSQYQTFLDPLILLTVAAGVTERVRLGTSTLNALWTPPVVLARSLASLDQFSRGRLDVGLGLGWSSDEYQAVGVPWSGRGARLEETLDIFEAAWSDAVDIQHTGQRWTVPAATIGAKPAQRPRPPILLGGFTPATFERVGRRADGWLGVAMPVPLLTRAWNTIGDVAEAAGRDPKALRMVVRLNPEFTQAPAPAEAVPRTGTLEQFIGYVRAAADAGVHEVLVDLQHATTTTAELLNYAKRIIDAVEDLR
jgi:probable F420-dependent oxidoreductase